jgi:hypothetical protein
MSLNLKRNLPLIAFFVGTITLLTIVIGSYPIIAY